MFDFKALEERVRKFWRAEDVFAKSLAQRRAQGAQPFVFFEGPPTANAAPAIHHFIGRVFKDAIPRYQTMRGRYVLRKGGWDTQGLPVELQVEKALGFKSKKDIEAYGVAAFNRKCRESVWQNQAEWEQFTSRIGYWIDQDQPYVTYENDYIESLWNVISRFAARKLFYQAHRVVPFCTRCGTPLSSHEVAQGYQTVTDTAVTVKFKVKKSKLKLPSNTFILAWTTTPWTLPGNVALAVGLEVDYVLARPHDGGEHYILAADLAQQVLGAPLAIQAQFKGRELVGTRYEPLFKVKALQKPKSYQVYPADFVLTTEGTGVVHTAVMYGEDDYQLGAKLGLVKHHTVDEVGKFVGVSSDLDGKYVKSSQTEELILQELKTKNFLLKTSAYEHEYPFCWRCETPLLYYAKDSWFVRMSAVNRQILANNATVNWVPGHLRDGRFGQWLREGKDWAFSRARYWGTPLPIWQSKSKTKGAPLVVSSLEDLDKYRGDKPATFWLVRHGESNKNVEHIIDGSLNHSPLTELGCRQAREGGRILKKKLAKAKPAVLISSPIQRARQTAELVAAELGVKEIVLDERLREIDLGPTLVGCHDDKYHRLYPTYEEKFAQRPPGGESLADLRARMWGLLKDLNAKYAGRHVILVSHDYPIWFLHDAAQGWTMAKSIAEKNRRGDDFAKYAVPEPLVVRNLPRDEQGRVDVHRPYIDEIVLKRPGSKTLLYRVPELCDVWFDSGAMPYAQWHWPFENKDIFKEQFPADFIAEGIDQTRGWFYSLLAVATALGLGAPYRNVLSYGHVLDEKGQKMSKSKGNIVKPEEVIDVVGVDAARWYFYTVNNPGDSKMFNLADVRQRLTGFMGTLANCLRFYELYNSESASTFDFRLSTLGLDQWLLSRLNGLVNLTTQKLDAYDLTTATRALEQFVVDDFSQWWLRRSRKRPAALGLLRHLLQQIALLAAPFIPFMAEEIWLKVRQAPDPISVHLADWPNFAGDLVKPELEQQMLRVREIITAGLAVRKDQAIRVRQPLAAVTVTGKALPADLEELIRDELNVKAVRYADKAEAAVVLDTHIGTELRAEGFAREVMRAIQDMRKDAGLAVGDKVYGQWFSSDSEVTAALLAHQDLIIQETGLSAFVLHEDDKTLTVEKNFDLAPGKPIWLGIRK